MVIKFTLILPDMCAETSCPFSKRTLNEAFGSAFVTVPSTSIESSFGTDTTLS